jgi:transcriptional regulator with XRE-family HTH domain
MMEELLPRKLRVLRAERGLTLLEVAAKAGIGRDTLSYIEQGRRHPSMPTLKKIADAYGVPVEDLIEEPVLSGKAVAPSPPELSEEERRYAYLRSLRWMVENRVGEWERYPERVDAEVAIAYHRILTQGGPVLGYLHERENLTFEERNELYQLTAALMGLWKAAEGVATEAQVAEYERLRPVA